MHELKKNGKLFTSKFVGTGPSSYEKKNLPGRGLTKVEKHCPRCTTAVPDVIKIKSRSPERNISTLTDKIGTDGEAGRSPLEDTDKRSTADFS